MSASGPQSLQHFACHCVTMMGAHCHLCAEDEHLMVPWSHCQHRCEPTEHVGCFCGPESIPEHCHLCSEQHQQLISADYCRMRRMKADPPAGWFNFGTHIDQDVTLEFYGQEFAEDGMPIWERPVHVPVTDEAV